MASRGRPSGAAGRAPRTGRGGVAKQRRSRAPLPRRTPPREPLRRSALTFRAAVLAVAIASVVLALALPFKIWIAQQHQIQSLAAQTRTQEQRVAQLKRERAQWRDPAFIERQARVRLHYARPGETTYVVLHTGHHHAKSTAQPTARPTLSGPWYSQLWQSVEQAGTASAQ